MMSISTYRLFFPVHVTVLLAVGLAVQSCFSQPGKDVTIATGKIDGTYYPLGGQLAWLLETGDYPVVQSAEAKITDGSFANLSLLIEKEADVALVGESKLLSDSVDYLKDVHVLSRLYTSVLHAVVRRDLDIDRLSELSDRRDDEPLKIFLDAPKSGARRTAAKVLEYLHIPSSSYTIDDSRTYREAAQRLVRGDIDVAIILEAMPSEEVEFAVAGGARLIGLGQPVPRAVGIEVEIPKYLYRGQEFPIRTIGDPAYLVARADLEDEIVVAVLDALFEHAGELARAHPIATDIRKRALVEDLPEGLRRHGGVEKFEEQGSSKLVIATGAASGSYYETGKIIQGLLKDRRVQSFVLQTDGSVENLEHLREDRPTLAIVQYDIALASHSYDPKAVYKVNPPVISDRHEIRSSKDDVTGWGIDTLSGMTRIATLYDEAMYIFARTAPEDTTPAFDLINHEGAHISFGPKESGTQILARAIFGTSQQRLERVEYLPVGQMIRQLQNGHLDIGFAFTNRRSATVAKLLADDSITLLSVPPQIIERIRGPAIQPHKVSPHYGRQTEAETWISTIKTNAVLVVNSSVSDDVVEKIAQAVIAGRDLLLEGDGLSQDNALTRLVTASSSIRLHPAAEEYYKENKYLPAQERTSLVEALRAVVVLLLGIASLGSIAVGFRHHQMANTMERDIIAVKLGAGTSDSVTDLSKIQAAARNALNVPWWKGGALSTSKWRSIDELADKRIAIARQLLTRALTKRIRAVGKLKGDHATLQREYSSIREEILEFFEAGELDTEQHDFLLRMMRREMA